MTTREHSAKNMELLEKAALVARWLEEKQGQDILGLDLRGLSEASETSIIVTARNVRHAQALADELLRGADEHSFEAFGMEGYKIGQWILVDLNDVVAHIFLRDVREYFNLEGLWAKAPSFVDTRQDVGSPHPDQHSADQHDDHHEDED